MNGLLGRISGLTYLWLEHVSFEGNDLPHGIDWDLVTNLRCASAARPLN